LSRIIPPDEEPGGGGLEVIRQLDSKSIFSIVINEHPQTTAIILAHLDRPVSSEVIQMLPEEKQMEVLHRLATLEHVSSKALRERDEVLRVELKALTSTSGNRLGGVSVAAEMMGFMARASEISILTDMDVVDPELADEIRSLRFTFEDIIKVDENGIQIALKELDQKDLLVSLKTATDELKEKIFSNMSARAGAMLKEDLEALPPTKVSDVDIAQKKVIAVFKTLEEEGKIVISVGSSDVLV
jgi:flagellar motor switch protein FliG